MHLKKSFRHPVRIALAAALLCGSAASAGAQTPPPQMPGATRQVLHNVLEVWGWGLAAARVNAAPVGQWGRRTFPTAARGRASAWTTTPTTTPTRNRDVDRVGSR